MPDIKFNCPECGSKLAIDSKAAGFLVDCPVCGRGIQIPAESTALPPRMVLPAEAAAAGTVPAAEHAAAADPAETIQLQERVHYLEKEKTELKQSLETAEQRNQNLARLEMKTADLLQQLEQMAEEYSTAQQTSQQFEIERNALKAHLETMTAESTRDRQQVTELAARTDALLKDNERLQNTGQTSTGETAALKKNLETLTAESARDRRQITELSARADALQKDNERLRNSSQSSAGESVALKERMAGLEQQIAEEQAAKAHMENLATELVQIRKEKSAASSRSEKLAAELERIRADLSVSEATRLTLESKLAAQHPRSPDAPAPTDSDAESGSRLTSLSRENETLQHRVEELSREKSSLAEALEKSQRNGQTEELKHRIGDLEKKTEDSRRQLREKETRLNSVTQQTEKLADENQALTAELIALRQKFIARESERSAAESPAAASAPAPSPGPSEAVKKELEHLRAQNAESENRAQQLIEDIRRLQGKLEEKAVTAAKGAGAAADASADLYSKPVSTGWTAKAKSWAGLGGWMCLAAGLAVMFVSLKLYYVYAPLLLFALVLAVIGLSPRKPLTGYTLLPALLLAPLALGYFLLRERAPDFLSTRREFIREAPAAAAAPAPAPPAAERTSAPSAAESAGPGGNVLVDGVRITFDRVRIDRIDRLDATGTRKQSEKPYLILECSMENTSPSQSVFLHATWEQSHLTDNLENLLRPAFPSRFAVDQVVGTITASELRPGQVLQDMIIFETPAETAQSFQMVSDPGFWRKTVDGGYTAISRATFAFNFTRDDLTRIAEP